VRVWLLGAYWRCLLARSGRTSVEVVCIDGHLLLALSYWGRRITQPLTRVHPDLALCARSGSVVGASLPSQAHPAAR